MKSHMDNAVQGRRLRDAHSIPLRHPRRDCWSFFSGEGSPGCAAGWRPPHPHPRQGGCWLEWASVRKKGKEAGGQGQVAAPAAGDWKTLGLGRAPAVGVQLLGWCSFSGYRFEGLNGGAGMKPGVFEQPLQGTGAGPVSSAPSLLH